MTAKVKGPPFWGKYRGVVTDNEDSRGRIRATVRDVFGTQKSGWAEPAFPYAGPHVGFFFVPPVGAMVWIEFEHGDPERPIWTGCFLREGEADLPKPASISPKKKMLRTDKWMLTIDDDGTKLEIAMLQGSNAKGRLTLEQNKITIKNGDSPLATVVLDGNKVSINGNALEVT